MTISEKEILSKMKAWCDRQERCHAEVRQKLWDIKAYGETADLIIAELISQNYLNETRFAQAYVSGKFRIKRWGRTKILRELKLRKISDYDIKIGLKEIDEEEYEKTIATLIEKKKTDYRKEKNPYVLKSKVSKYLISRGFEPQLVWEQLRD